MCFRFINRRQEVRAMRRDYVTGPRDALLKKGTILGAGTSAQTPPPSSARLHGDVAADENPKRLVPPPPHWATDADRPHDVQQAKAGCHPPMEKSHAECAAPW